MKIIIKGIANIIFAILLCIGLLLIITEVPEDAPISEIIKINGGGVALFCISLLILSNIDSEEKGDC